MKKHGIAVYALGLALLLLAASFPALAQVSVTTQHNDLNRSGDNLNETILTQNNVNVSTFGLLDKITVDNQIYGQPLVVSGLAIAGGTHNVVFVGTTNNSVYAFDADTGAQYWHVNFGTPITNANYGTGCVDIDGEAGIVGTPVISTSTNTLYIVNSLNNAGTFSFMLHALNLATGADNSGSPVQITTSGFQPLLQNQRAASVLANGNLYIPFSSHCDMGAYHGYLFSYNPTTLAQIGVFNTSPTGSQDSLWMSGQGPAVDSSGNIYFGTSNGSWNGVSNFSESFIKLSPALALEDWFTAANHATLDGGDLDLDTSGPLLIPGSTSLFMVGKSATGYVINSGNMGHLGDASALETVKLGGALHGSAIYFDSAVNGPEVYTWAIGDPLKAFKFNGTDLTLPNFQSGPETISGEPAAYLSLSANGTSNGIVWANAVLSGDANHMSTPGVLRAFDADNISTELYNNQQNATRDTCDNFAKDSFPTIANGKVYLSSFGTGNAGTGELCIYGVLPTNCTTPSNPSALTATAVSGSQINLSWTASTSSTGCTVSYIIYRSTVSGFTPSSTNEIANGDFNTTFSDINVVPATTYYYLVEATDASGTTSGASNQATATSGAAITNIAVNAGGPAVSPFLADEYFTGGSTQATATAINTSNVTNPAPMAVYQTGRYGDFTYTIPGFAPNSSQTVRLHFAETYWDCSGCRVFNVSINGAQVLANFDIFATAGGEFIANVQQFTETANSSGQYIIAFTSVTDNPLVSGIQIGSGAACNVPTAPSALTATAASSSQVNLSWTASSSTCSIDYDVFRSTTSGFTPSSANEIAGPATGITGTTYQDATASPSTTYYYLLEATSSAGTSGPSNQATATTPAGSSGGPCTVLCINSGSTTAVSPFVADEDFTGGATIDHANTINASNVTNPAPAAVYQTGRDGNFTYTIGGLTAGTDYVIRLHFCETYWTAAGKRTFNVSINGTQVLTDFDIYATAGGQNIANIQQFTEPANSSGQFVIVFTTVINNSLVSGIEIDSTSSSCTAPTTPTGLTATAASSSQINLSWTASTSSCSITYNVFSSTTSGFTPSSTNQIASGVTGTTFSNTGLAASTTYYYVVQAQDSAGDLSGTSTQASATTQPSSSCTAAPTAPSGLGATATSSSQINLSWTASTAGSGCSITYSVFRSTTSGFTASSANQIATGVTTTTYSSTGLAASTTYYYLVESVDSSGTSAASNQATATTQAASSVTQLIAIDSGSTTAVSPFVADEDFTGGAAQDFVNTINTSEVVNPAPAAVYQTGRFGNFTYTIGGFTAGSSQTVRLHFAETYWTGVGQRVFNVSINGTQVLTNFDIIAASGGENIAVIEQFTEPANASGQYVIQFTTVTDNALVSGIEIDTPITCSTPTAPSALTATAASATQINLSWAAGTSSSYCSVMYNVFRSTTSGFTPSSSNQIASGKFGTTYTDSGLTASTTYYYLVESTNSGGTSAASNQATATTTGALITLAINAGGPAESPFVADEDFSGGTTTSVTSTINIANVTNPAPMAVYQSNRYGAFTYTIPGFVASSSHTVRLHFAETYFSAAGKREFNVSINGTQVLTDFDIFATAGGENIANIQQFTESASSTGTFTITFTSVVDNSLVCGIEID